MEPESISDAIRHLVHAELASLGGRLLEEYGDGDPENGNDNMLAQLGGLLLEHYGEAMP